MLEKVTALLESEGAALVEAHEDVLVETIDQVQSFPKTLKSFILSNQDEFIGESVEDTYKNVRVFAEVATSQFVHEMTTLTGSLIAESSEEAIAETSVEPSISEYL
ncbi:MAG: hypothetical protein PHD05_00645 [Sphaerochaetaceae bacterium]|jgi:hypothetical protein|nr:hypothetical protein [Sphaerochaetaceae bacterium]